ncbi:acyltransferase [Parvularcula flava]|uniref:Acyltransferase n=1 Tax=Aquisalinus luteolus TaxID=1566827 RepID=A0A8J3A1N6_9PROT|nr:acyltransferase family protein [Aquisalinus luteolus]NHK27761.1 acyltransferase [Aquisalinus luteolus]GGH96420.1 acyltransferase [Aquisalinus luteolus]
MQYRPEIDGLRALAVTSVVLFHADTSFFSGGYVGVDIFFVISGFLITKIILGEMVAGEFTFASFYERRIRRLLPPAIPVFLFCLVTALFLYQPEQFEEFSRSLIAAAAFVSNWLFLAEADYFAEAAEIKLLLHTWSLAVEEQFYLIFPVAALLMMRARGVGLVRNVLIGVFVLSFGASVWVVQNGMEVQAFYNSFLRFWELMLGALLAVGVIPEARKNWQAIALRVVGAAAMLCPVFLYTENTAFPGLSALLPTAGAAAFIAAGGLLRKDPVYGFFAAAPVVFIGKISYALYLWHWPLLILARLLAPGSSLALWASIAAATVLSILSYYVLEQPFRRRKVMVSRQAIYRFMLASTGVLVVLGGTGIAMKGIPARFDQEVVNTAFFLSRDRTVAQWEKLECAQRMPSLPNYKSICIATEPDKKNVMLIGDSHAQHLYPGLKTHFPDVNFVLFTIGSCRPLPQLGDQLKDDCRQMAQYVFEEFDAWDEIDTVIVSFRSHADSAALLVEKLPFFTQRVGDVVVIGPFPEYSPPLNEVFMANTDKRLREIQSLVNEGQQARTMTKETYYRENLPENVRYYSIFENNCDRECDLFDREGHPFVFDYGHVTLEGSVHYLRNLRL